MNRPPSDTSIGPRTGAWRVLAAVLALVGTACLIMWSDQPAPVSTRPAASPTSQVPGPRPGADPTERDVAPKPVYLTIPAINVSTSLTRLGLQPDNTVEVPADPDVAGWFRPGTPPGELGSSVILGHVDSVNGPAVFYRLKDLRPGESMGVRRTDGSVAEFEVTSVVTYPNSRFPASRVYGSHGSKQLNLVTCGGAYDSSNGGYQSNVVVYTRWVSTRRQAAARKTQISPRI